MAAVAQVQVEPATASVVIGAGQQFKASGHGAVVWSVAASDGSGLSAGTVSSEGWYQTPYPAPKSVTVTATGKGGERGTAELTLVAPALAVGPALKVDAGAKTHPISPLIYGMNGYSLSAEVATKIKLPVDRWGGDGATTYNYHLDVGNAGSDWYFETNPNKNDKYPDVSAFNTQVERDRSTHTLTMGTVPLIGRMTKRQQACSFSVAKYGPQQKVDPYRKDCGNGMTPDGKDITGNDPDDVSYPINHGLTTSWVKYLVNRYGDAAHGGVGIYELDNEPEYWSGVHKDIHPAPLSYDELTTKGLVYAAAIKAADPTAQVSGPVIASFQNYFYSWADLKAGWASGPCYCYNGHPADRLAHKDVPLIEYYLQQFKAYEAEHGVRLLDYLDLHGYYAPKGADFKEAGDTALQRARLESTRSMWDAGFTESKQVDPNVRDKGAKPVAVRLIPRMKEWVAKDYPGTKTAITEYNWGGQEHINGALALADSLGIFGREGLDLATLWGPPDPVKQLPGLKAFELYRNYDGAGSMFGDVSLLSTSADQGKLSVYGALRSSDGAVTVIVLNKSFGDLQSLLTVANAGSVAKRFVYSSADLSKILAQPAVRLSGGTATVTFPAASVTLLVVGK
jgi:hypothetical protein